MGNLNRLSEACSLVIWVFIILHNVDKGPSILVVINCNISSIQIALSVDVVI